MIARTPQPQLPAIGPTSVVFQDRLSRGKTATVSDNALFLDDETFIAGHAYRVLVRKGTESLGTALIYLYPPAMASRAHQITFDDVDRAPTAGESIAIAKKPAL